MVAIWVGMVYKEIFVQGQQEEIELDIVADPENFANYLTALQVDWKKGHQNFFEVAEGWKRLCKDYFDGLISIEKLEGQNILVGEALGKKFSVELFPVVKRKTCYGQAVVTVLFHDGTTAEATRFLINRHAHIVDEEGKTILDPDSGKGSASMLTSIGRAVLELPKPPRPTHFSPR
ncbi:hypothetical protein N5E96_12400 [Pseudomonas mosselii]|uniref:hypothetical protein n=1 Tax=Pseudomonas mosselii TaxID=78327 RepID=UPI00244D1C2E|nr:hypothetical protein [Pseudomonas mosselii]MDH1656537.1 hypothetical protein [Pseudomonas mosselii]MDH1717961.1 hypothetical protein [Pseudomonas mosselii]MDH1722085.1 hypothetical protein [Pseudomonas mosselii]